VIRSLAPPVIAEDQLQEGLDILESAFAAASPRAAQPVR